MRQSKLQNCVTVLIALQKHQTLTHSQLQLNVKEDDILLAKYIQTLEEKALIKTEETGESIVYSITDRGKNVLRFFHLL